MATSAKQRIARKAGRKGTRLQRVKRVLKKLRYPNPNYYAIGSSKRLKQKRAYPPPKHIAGALLKDNTAYGKPLTAKQKGLFAHVSAKGKKAMGAKKGNR